MRLFKIVVRFFLATILIISGIAHFMTPEMYLPFIPDFLPKSLINLLAGGVEIILAVGIFVPAFSKRALQGILLLMIVFLPIHILDAFKENPAIGSKTAALVRIAIQLVLIYLPWWARKKDEV